MLLMLLSAALVIVTTTQAALLVILLARLIPGRSRRPPEPPVLKPTPKPTVSVIVPTLNEVSRLALCLRGLSAQVAPLIEILIVDSQSTDGTREMVQAAALRDPRIRLITDPPLPRGWIGKVWALETGFSEARGEWILGIDADTEPAPGLVGSVLQAAERDQLDAASFAPCFAEQSAAERLVQPAMLLTLIYRCGAAGVALPPPSRVLANGQCFLVKRALLAQHGGYAPARTSFCDDVTLARHLASRGARVGFLDGSAIIQVRAYASLREMWREWGRSFSLRDATARGRRVFDLALIWLLQALPLPVLTTVGLSMSAPDSFVTGVPRALLVAFVGVNVSALLVRVLLLTALRGSYAERGAPFWCSWLADIPAAIRLTLSMLREPTRWRGREYAPRARAPHY